MVSELKDNKHKELKRIAKQWNEQNESTNKWIQIIKSNHILQMKTTMTEMKNSLAGINSGCEHAEEERISKLKDRIIEIIQSKVQGKKEWKKKKWTELEGCVKYQEYQYMHHTKRKGQEKIF